MNSKKNDALNNKKNFEIWVRKCNENGSCNMLMYSRESGKDENVTLDLGLVNGLRQVYPFSEQHKYYNILIDLPEFYYVTDAGLVVSTYGDIPRIIVPKLKKNREYYECSVKRNGKTISLTMQLATLVNLVFEGRSTKNAQLLLNEFGIDAIRSLNRAEMKALQRRKGVSEKSKRLIQLLLDKGWRSYHLVQINHESGFKKAKAKADIEELRAYNCDISRTQFEYTLEHLMLTYAPKKDASNSEVRNYLSTYYGVFDGPTVIAPYAKNAGTIIDDISNPALSSTDFGKHKYCVNNIQLVGLSYKANLLLKYDDGSELEKGVNVSNVDYVYFVEKYRTFLKDFGVPMNAYLGQSADNKDVYGYCEYV